MTSRTARALLSGAAPPVVGPEATLAQADCLLRRGRHEAAAVVRRDSLLGLVLADDLEAARPSAATTLTRGEAAGALARIPVTAIMRSDVATVTPETPLAEVARLVRDSGAPVAVLSGEWLVGLIGARDLLTVLEPSATRL